MRNIKNIVNNLVDTYKTSNIFELCDYLDINIKNDPLGTTKGYFLNISEKHFIVLNSDLEEWEERVVLAHELGHALLHKETNICFLKTYTYCNANKLENEANAFAAHLLIDDDALNCFSTGYDCVTMEQLGKHFKVPEELIVYKFL